MHEEEAKRNMLRILFHPKTIVIAGIVLTIISALLSHHEIRQNEQDIRALEQQHASHKQKIEHLWQQNQLVERQQDTTLLLLAAASQPDASSFTQDTAHSYYHETLSITGANVEPHYSTDQLHDAVSAFQQRTNTLIDTLYLDNLSLEKDIFTLTTHNSMAQSLALFFQVLGMILVLSYNVWDYTRRH